MRLELRVSCVILHPCETHHSSTPLHHHHHHNPSPPPPPPLSHVSSPFPYQASLGAAQGGGRKGERDGALGDRKGRRMTPIADGDRRECRSQTNGGRQTRRSWPVSGRSRRSGRAGGAVDVELGPGSHTQKLSPQLRTLHGDVRHAHPANPQSAAQPACMRGKKVSLEG